MSVAPQIVALAMRMPRARLLVCCGTASACAGMRDSLKAACAEHIDLQCIENCVDDMPDDLVLNRHNVLVLRFAEAKYQSHIVLLERLPTPHDVSFIARSDGIFIVSQSAATKTSVATTDIPGLSRLHEIASAVHTPIYDVTTK